MLTGVRAHHHRMPLSDLQAYLSVIIQSLQGARSHPAESSFSEPKTL